MTLVFGRWVLGADGGERAYDWPAAAGIDVAGLDRGTGLPVLLVDAREFAPPREDPSVGAVATGYVSLGHGLETVVPGSVLIVADEEAGSAFGYVIARCRSDSAPSDEITVGVDLATWRHAEEEP